MSKEEKVTILLTPGGIKLTLDGVFRLTRDLKNTMNKTRSNIVLEIDPSGSAVKIFLKGLDGKELANSNQLAGIGGIRRFISDATKQAEKETADHEKIAVAKNLVDTEGTIMKKMKPDGNGRVSELIRMARNAIKNRLVMDQWDDEDETGIMKKYLLGVIDEVITIVKDEIRLTLESGKIKKDYIEESLENNVVPRWYYDQFTTQNSVTVNMQDPIDFVFPKNNFQNGVKIRLKEVKDSFLEKHWMILKGNEELIHVVKEYMRDIAEPAGKDAKRQVADYLENIKILLKPDMTPIEMIERYKDSKFKIFEQGKLPEGEAGYTLKKKIPNLNAIMSAWNEYHRFIMHKEADKDSYWSLIVDKDAYDEWDLTAQQNVKYWVNELDQSEILLTEEWKDNVFNFMLSRLNIYSDESRSEFLKIYCSREYMTCEEKYNLKKEQDKELAQALDLHKSWLAKYSKMKDTTPEEVAEKEKEARARPIVPLKLEFDEIASWYGARKYTEITAPTSMGAKERKIKGDFTKGMKDYEKVFNMTKDDAVVSEETEKAYLKYFKGLSSEETSSGGNIGIADRLTDVAKELLSELTKNKKYGKVLKPKVENWLVTTFAGASILQDVAAEAIVIGLKNQDFYEEDKDGE